jgi:DNA-binding NarL/FixJ family response regulator
VLAHCASVAETLQAVRQHRPDVLLLDLRMPETGGLTVLRQIKKEELPTRVVLLTGVTDEDAMLEAIHLGVCGVVLKDTPPEVVLQCVRAVHAGAQWLERRSISHALEGLLRLEALRRQSESGLASRELEIVRLVEAGLRNKEIADRLSLSFIAVTGGTSQTEIFKYCFTASTAGGDMLDLKACNRKRLACPTIGAAISKSCTNSAPQCGRDVCAHDVCSKPVW